MIEFKHLRLMMAIKSHGSLSEAGKVLNLSPSALSHQLKQLEEYLEVQLFERFNNKLLFTQAGRELLEYGRTILSNLDDLEQRVVELKKIQQEKYVHGYSSKEMSRLLDQASTVAEFIHWDSLWEEGSTILEAGCGIGAQTQIIAANNPGSKIIAVDISRKSIANAKELIQTQQLANVELEVQDLRHLNYPDEYFDHVFVCFVLEHTESPKQVIKELKRVLKTGGTITIVEGDHGSTYFYPHSQYATKAVRAQVQLQERNGGNANIGREIYPLLNKGGFNKITVSPRQIYVDESKHNLYESFVKKTFTAMIEGVKDEAVSKGIISEKEMQSGIKDLHAVADTKGVFCYTFFKGTAEK